LVDDIKEKVAKRMAIFLWTLSIEPNEMKWYNKHGIEKGEFLWQQFNWKMYLRSMKMVLKQ
jgi:hypothetical protein